MLPDFTLVRPESLDEALGIVDEHHVPICGGTELLLAMSVGMLWPTALVDLSRLDELRTLAIDGNELGVGAAVTHREVHRHPQVRERVPVLAEVAAAIGNARVRAQGSVGGNLCFAEPKSDLTSVLIALNADVVLAGPAGRRRLPVHSFLDGPYTTVRADGELLEQVRVPLHPSRRCRYLKFQTMERPTVGVAVSADDDRVRVVVGAVGPAPVHRDFGSVGEVDVGLLTADVQPLADLSGSAEYKRHVAGVYVRRALEELR